MRRREGKYNIFWKPKRMTLLDGRVTKMTIKTRKITDNFGETKAHISLTLVGHGHVSLLEIRYGGSNKHGLNNINDIDAA